MEAESEEEGEKEKEVQHKTLNHNSLYYTFIQRYFTTYQSEKQVLYRHSNGLYLVGVRLDKDRPTRLEEVLKFQQVKGKKKHGGLRVHRSTVLANLHFETGVEQIYCMVEGCVIDRNPNANVDNIGTPQGYLVVIMPDKQYNPHHNIFTQIPNPH